MKVVVSGKNEKFSFSVKLSDDRLKLFLDASPIAIVEKAETPNPQSESTPVAETVAPKKVAAPTFPSVNKDEILAILPKEVWDGCIHHEVVDNVAKELSKGTNIEERRIAKGTPAQDGHDGRCVITVKKMSPKAELHEDTKGFVDFRELHRFENIRIGTVVAKLYPPQSGTPGTDPLGKSLPAKNGQVTKLAFDQTIVAKNHSEGGGQDLVAQTDGFLSEDAGKISIQEELKISGNIDYQVGSIDFVGSVVVQGDVLPGFVVRGRKGVVIRGSVQEATICSSEGSIEIRGHCMGSLSTKIESKETISFNVVNQIDAQAGVHIEVGKEARDCELRSGGTISGVKAALIGGSLFTACGIEAREVGARGGAKTQISLSSSVSMTREFAENQRLLVDHEKVLAMIKAHLGPLAKSESGLATLSPSHQEKLMPLILKKRTIETSLVELKLKRDTLLASAQNNHQFKVNYLEKLHSGVVVQVGEEAFEVKETLVGPKSLSFDPEKKVFEVAELSALECSIVEVTKEKNSGRKTSK